MVVALFLLWSLLHGFEARLTPERRPAVGAGPLDSVFDPILQRGIREGVYPGAVLIVGRRDTILFARGYGRFTWSQASAAVNVDSTFWDLASLTKVVATTPALMLLVQRGRVDLDAPVVRYVPEFNSPGTGTITIRHLLTHTSGSVARCRSRTRRIALQQ